MTNKVFPNDEKTNEKLFTTAFILVLFLAVMNSTIQQTLNSNIPVYAKSIGADNVMAGLLVTVFMISAIVIRPFWGYLSDTKGRRIVVLFGTIIVAVIVFGYQFANCVTVLLILRSLHGLGFSANTNTTATMASDIVPKKRLSEGIGYYGLANVIATAIGPALGIYIVQRYNYKTLFNILGIIGILCVVAAYFIKYEKKLLPKPKDSPKPKLSLYEKSAVPISAVMLCVALGSGSITSFIPLLSLERGIENFSIYYTVYALSLFSTRLIVGKLCDRYGSAKVIYPALAFISLAYLTYAMVRSLPLLLLGGVLYGFGFGTAQPMLNALMVKRCPIDRRGVGNSTFYIAMDTGNAVGAAIGGTISQYFGFTALYLFCELYVISACVIFTAFLKRSARIELNNAQSTETREI